MSVTIYTIIDDDIVINQQIKNNIYEYLINIVDQYKEHSLLVYMILMSEDKAYYIKLYENEPPELTSTCA